MPEGTTNAAAKLQNTKGYISHQTFDGFYLMERSGAGGRPEWVIYDENLNIQDKLDNSYSYEKAVNRVRDWQKRRTAEAAPGYVEPSISVAPDIGYQDIESFIDSGTGDITNKEGLINYLQGIPGMEGKTYTQLESLLSTMPNLSISGQDMAQATGQRQSDIYGLQSQLASQRQQGDVGVGMSGVYSPTSTGFGLGEDTFASGAYSNLAKAGASSADIYGLGEEKEEAFAKWLQNIIV